MLSPHPVLRIRDCSFGRKRVHALFDQTRVEMAYSARSALYQLCVEVRGRTRARSILMPGFHCASIVEAVVRAGFQPIFYRIRRDLSIDYEDLFSKVHRDVALILVIHYFGFPADISPLLRERKQLPCYLVEDWAHSFLRGSSLRLRGELGDFALFSFYKLLPMHVDGGIRINRDDFPLRLREDRPVPDAAWS